jgi:hypothetical protein
VPLLPPAGGRRWRSAKLIDHFTKAIEMLFVDAMRRLSIPYNFR